MKLTIDFETSSIINIKACGTYVYAAHPSTDVLCLALKVDEEPALLWTPNEPPQVVLDTLVGADIIEAHNVQFEREIWRNICHNRWGWPMLLEEKLRCSMAKAAMHALPQSLEDLCIALGLPAHLQKDVRGKSLIDKLCIPRSPRKAEWEVLEEKFGNDPAWRKARLAYERTTKDKKWAYLGVLAANWKPEYQEAIFWNRDEDNMNALGEYCKQDVEAEHACSRKMWELTPGEMAVWRLDQRINVRGIRVDREGAKAAIRMVSEHSAKLTSELHQLTNGMVRTAKQGAKLQEWATRRGVQMPDAKAATIEVYAQRPDTPADVKRVLEIRSSLNKASTAKYLAALNASQTDGKLRGWSVFCGAGTGRFASRLMQLHNLPRGTVKLKTDRAIDQAYAVMKLGADAAETLYGDPMDLATSSIRGVLIADPGKRFLAADFASVEARKLAWLTGDEPVLKQFRDNVCVYIEAATGIFNTKPKEITKKDPRRQVGKCAVLALGFGGGIGAFANMARTYRVDLETLPAVILPTAELGELRQAESTAESYVNELERKIKHGIGKVTELDRMSIEAATACDIIKQRWRRDRPLAVRFWKELEDAAFEAVQYPGKTTGASMIEYRVKDDFLLCRLPSKRVLFYYRPHIKTVKKFGRPAEALHYWGMKALDSGGQKYQQIQTYGGKLCENVVQASCACLLRGAMLRVEENGYPVVLHVHDEVVSQREIGCGDFKEYVELVAEVPSWAKGMPMGAEGWEGFRYRKD